MLLKPKPILGRCDQQICSRRFGLTMPPKKLPKQAKKSLLDETKGAAIHLSTFQSWGFTALRIDKQEMINNVPHVTEVRVYVKTMSMTH